MNTTGNSNPWSNDGGAEVNVTLKQSKDYAAPWIVVKGGSTEAVKAELAKATGLSGDGLTLTELVYNAAYSFQKISTVATGLDAVVIPLDSKAQDGAVSDVQAESAPEPTQAASEPQEGAQEAPEVDLKAEVEKQTTKAGLQALFLKNKDAFNGDAELMAALQARFTHKEVS